LKQLTKKDNRIVLFRNEQNLKLVKTLNNMIAHANGKYIARMDADDISLPERIEKQVVWLETHSDYVICGTNVWYITEEGKKFRKSHIPSTNEEINRAKYYKSPFLHPSIMITREVISAYLYKDGYFTAEDYELWLRILEKHKGYNLKEKLLLYRYHLGSVTNAKRDEANKLLVKIFSEKITNGNISLAEKYVYGFLDSTMRIDIDGDFNVLLLDMLKNIKDCSGFNFYILLRYFKFYMNNKRIGVFIRHLSPKDNIIFFTKLIIFLPNFAISSFRKR
jgi:glycosyltransferase involved in cell wall biosynthesis